MDLVACGSKVIVLMEHTAKSKDGTTSLKLLEKCKLPLTGKGVVSMVITELAVFENKGGKLILTEISEDTTIEEVQKQTGFNIICAEKLGKFWRNDIKYYCLFNLLDSKSINLKSEIFLIKDNLIWDLINSLNNNM